MSDASEILERPSIRWFLTSGFLSGVAIALMLAVLFKQAFDLTGDPFTIGLIGLLQFIPALLLVTVSGDVADRFDRRRVTAVMTVGRAVCALAFVWFSRSVSDVETIIDASGDVVGPSRPVSLWPLYLITLAFGSFDAIAIPARHAIPPLLVERGELSRLVAISAVTRVFAGVLGPVSAGYLYSASAELAYGVVAVLFVFSIPPILWCFFVREQTKLTERPSFAMAFEGMRFIRRSPIVLSAIALDLFAVLFGGAVALIPVIAAEQLGVGDVGYGWLRAAPGIGAGLMGMWLARRPVKRRVGPTLLGVVAVFGLFHITLGLTGSYPIAFLSLVIAAAADMVSMTIRLTLVPLATPDDQLGRVSAVEGVFIGASNELGAFESGVAARYLGVPLAVAGGGVATIAIAAAFSAFVPALRNIDTYDDVQPIDPAAPATA